MDADLQKYLIEQCREWMLPEEIRALRRIGFTETGEKETRVLALVNPEIERSYGFFDDETNQLVELGKEKLYLTIAENLLRRKGNEILNRCPKCNKLTRTPMAKQCRYCGHDWH